MGSRLEQLYRSSHFSGNSAAFVEALYEAWLENPDAVNGQWREAFEQLGNGAMDTAHGPIIERFRQLARMPAPAADSGHAAYDHKQAGVLRLINAYRVRGHQKASLDPLMLSERPHVPDLNLEFHDLDQGDLGQEFDTGSVAMPARMLLKDIITIGEAVYCRNIGVEYMHITDTRQRQWLQHRLEASGGNYGLSATAKTRILQKLTAAEGLEKYLHTKYVGQKRFSLEGAESMIPLLHETILHCGTHGIKEMVIGMAHRGRLNVLINVLGKPPAQLFNEFEGEITHDAAKHSGDVKYHMGYSSDVNTPGGPVHLALAFNPSHLEIVDPVVAGSARARQVRRKDFAHQEVLPVLIHGDAAFAGQGVVMELFNMSQARGFAVGGSMHIIVNNQIGFTTSNPLDARSTLYCTEVAKMVQAPVFHVNADDPEAVVFITQLAADFRQKFRKDIVIDLVCYRRHGHNEADEPAATQPMMYKTIRKLKTTRQQYAEKLANEGVLGINDSKKLVDGYRDALDNGETVVDVLPDSSANEYIIDWGPYLGHKWTDQADTGVAVKTIRDLSDKLTALPQGFKLHNRVQRIIDDRRKMAVGDLPMDWGFAETLAYASLINDGYGLRLVGQDSGRGTFFHRHAVLHGQEQGKTLLPLAKLSKEPNVTVIDSLLSEEAVLGFEYGYATADPSTLVIWEAQFGDFVNGAQVVIDQFITSGEAKWGRLCGLTMFLPHGYEGQGPEHSSARLERFMQLCSRQNIQVCVPTTPAQMFHLLRRQMIRPYRKPLIVMTPKSLLRHKLAVSSLEQLESGAFQLVIDDRGVEQPETVQRVVLCAGKVYYDLLQAREKTTQQTALLRVEQLYPFPREAVSAALSRYAKATEVVWCQEEPMNQGAWYRIRHHVQACMNGQQLYYAGRASSPSPAVGYYAIHVEEQNALVEQALTLGQGEIQ